jgi:lipopolysaccharide biosynthesis glycosyltransferase
VRRNKIVFVVTSKGLDIHSAMTRIAIESVRISNPLLDILLCLDIESNRAMISRQDPILDMVDRVVLVYNVTGEDPLFVNRSIKTNLLEHVEPPVLFLDSDVLVRYPLDEIFLREDDISLVYNNNANKIEDQLWEEDSRVFDQLGWPTPKRYFNGGVVFYNNTKGAKDFSKKWHESWKHTFSITQRYRDQPALNHVIENFGGRATVLDNKYNVQFRTNTTNLKDGIIWHYYFSGKSSNRTSFQDEVDRILDGKAFEKSRVQKLMKRNNPWNFKYKLNIIKIKVQAFIKNKFR